MRLNKYLLSVLILSDTYMLIQIWTIDYSKDAIVRFSYFLTSSLQTLNFPLFELGAYIKFSYLHPRHRNVLFSLVVSHFSINIIRICVILFDRDSWWRFVIKNIISKVLFKYISHFIIFTNRFIVSSLCWLNSQAVIIFCYFLEKKPHF